MIKIYGSKICSGCRDCQAELTLANVPYEFVEITQDIASLRAFLKLRDALPMYDEIRAEGRVGIPLIQREDGSFTFEWREFLPENA